MKKDTSLYRAFSLFICWVTLHGGNLWGRPVSIEGEASATPRTSERAPLPFSVRPREEFYPADDPARALKIELELAMGLYLVAPPRRHRSERVEINGDRVTFHLWHPVAAQENQALVSRALRWLIFGRTRYSGGARALFSESNMRTLTIDFHEVNRPENSRRRRGKETVKSYLRMTLSRDAFERLELGEVEDCLERTQCLRLARRKLKLTLNRRYTRRARRKFRRAQ
ncbi:MAG: hypothetical protein VYD19_11355 [Myxococcota bacterium]|nr:hypothetical protein [Myxococcota bacterium]